MNAPVPATNSSKPPMKWKLSLTHPSGAEFGLEFKGDPQDLNSLRNSLPPIIHQASDVMMVQSHQAAHLNQSPTPTVIYPQSTTNYYPQQSQPLFPPTNPTIPFTQDQIGGSPTVLQDYSSYLPPASYTSPSPDSQPTVIQASDDNYYQVASIQQGEQPTVIQRPGLAALLSKLSSAPSIQNLKAGFTAKPVKYTFEIAFWLTLIFLLCANPTTRGFINGIPLINSIAAATDGINPVKQFYTPKPVPQLPAQPVPQQPQQPNPSQPPRR